MITQEEINEIAKNYESYTIGVLGSHSAEEVGMAAKAAKVPVVAVCQKGREELYTRHSAHLFSKIIVLDKFSDITSEAVQERLREMGTIFIPNRSFSVYVGYDAIENDFKIPIYGNRWMLRTEERTAVKSQYYLLEKAGIRFPKKFNSPEEIDRLAVVKVQQKQNPLERAFFYPSSPEDYYAQAKELLYDGVISKEGLKTARIEEFVLGPRFNANFQSYAVKDKFGDFDFVGFDDRIQTDLTGLLNLPARDQMKIKVYPRNEEVGHKGITMRESLKPLVYNAAEKFIRASEKEFPPGIIGLFALQGALPYNKETKRPEFVVFDVSPRIPGSPCVGPTSPEMRRLSLKYELDIRSPLDLCIMELKYAMTNSMVQNVIT
ncbi:MAG: DUF1297 domain-containing protein [Candidatus Diapherotrites archaeon]|nr:DUF1297 domain-containing protein [Candidatus Diapherotrites archaeon]